MAAGTDVSHWFSIATPAQKGRKQARSVKTGKVIPRDAANLGGNDGRKFSPGSSKQTYGTKLYACKWHVGAQMCCDVRSDNLLIAQLQSIAIQ